MFLLYMFYVRKILNKLQIFVLIFIFFFSFTDLCAQVKSGYRWGINMTTMSVNYQGQNIKSEIPFGVHFGANYEIPLSKHINFLSGFLFSSKGTDYALNNVDYSIAPAYLEIPANFSYNFTRRSTRLSLFSGPYFAAAFGGYKSDDGYKILTLGSRESKDLKFLDFGYNVGIALNIKSHVITIQYGTGLRDVSPKNDIAMRNKVIGISLSTLWSVKE